MKKYIFFLVLIFSCSRSSDYSSALPHGFPEIAYPENNIPNIDRVELGKRLFFDERLSKDSTISCASCHKPEFAFADNVSVSEGVNGPIGFRNSPSLINVAYQKSMFMDGGIPTLELQAIAPIMQDAEQNMSIMEAAERFIHDEEIQELSWKAYGTELTASVITKALATYERSLVSSGSRFDRFYYLNEPEALTEQEKTGWEIFNNKGNCNVCHSPYLFANHTFQNIGLYEVYADLGRFRITDDSADIGKFKVPSLRNVALTAPYMHDGSLPNLENVVEHFNLGGKDHANKSDFIQPLDLSHEEKQALVAFLKSLTDTTLVN